MTTKGELSKQKILQAAIDLFSRNSFRDVTIRQIARTAEVSPGLIYKYYEDQEALYYEAMKSAGQEFVDLLEPIPTLEEFVRVYLDHMFNSEVLFGMMTYFMIDVEQPPNRMPIIADVAKLLKLIEQKIPSVNARIEAQLLFSTMNGLLISYKKIPNHTKEEALASIYNLSRYYLEHLNNRASN